MASAVKCPICEFENPDGQAKCRRCGTPMPDLSSTSGGGGARLRPGQLLANRYYIVAEIGRGGMGSIYRAKDNTLKEAVALKTLLPQFLQDKHVVERFFNEARIARQLSHPNIVRVHDIGASQGTVYISMELLNGKSLRQMLEELMPGDRLPMRTVLDIFDQLCAALEYAHRYTVHRDLKPENVMVMDDGTVKLMDFGISKLMGEGALTSASMVMGTPHYMPPEQIKHSAGVDQRADIYSLGVMLYEALTGGLPTAIHKPVSKIVRGIPPALDPIIETCLQDDPSRRYGSAGELRTALEAVREQLGFTEGPSMHRPRLDVGRPRVKNPRRVGGVLLVAVLLAATGYGLWRAEAARNRAMAETVPVPEQPAEMPTPEPAADTAREPEPLTADFILNVLPTARARADAAVRGLADSPVKEHRRALFGEAETWAEAAGEYRETDPDLALPASRRALHLYLALAHWPPNAFFVPPTESEGGVFIQAGPVTAGAFEQFTEAKDWRLPEAAESLPEDGPMVYATWYDAQAFCAAQERLNRLPTADEWNRAVAHAARTGTLRWIGEAEVEQRAPDEEADSGEDSDTPAWQPELWVEDGLLEWTRSRTDAKADAPSFGDTMRVLGVAKQDAAPEGIEQAIAYQETSDIVGFRGAHALPLTQSDVRRYIQR